MGRRQRKSWNGVLFISDVTGKTCVLFNIAATCGKKWRPGHIITGEEQVCLIFVTTYLKTITTPTGERTSMGGKGGGKVRDFSARIGNTVKTGRVTGQVREMQVKNTGEKKQGGCPAQVNEDGIRR
ncbi:hypothetical protein CYR55_10615 [Chimaeribacter californicus]|uniref:Uncharacterized protein n=1 Tax=Chimaeribacter californicus TaxID=2060067 RepID=A0A2N5E7C1_9GAMM|nr:hypothetical protein [Chimaeribacter californicus]PLR37376.1 hypothetical protein CYR55_10615 [Chimaeribacter californicus]